MKIYIILLTLLSCILTENLDSSSKIINSREFRTRRERNLRAVSAVSLSEESSEETRDINSNTKMRGETVDTDVDNLPSFHLDEESLDSDAEKKGEIEEMKTLVGKDLIKTVPNALHHHVVFPWTFPHVGMLHQAHGPSEAQKIEGVEP